jgi:hypothetical protein
MRNRAVTESVSGMCATWDDIFFQMLFEVVHWLLQVEGALHDCYRCVVSAVDIRDVLSERKGHPVSQKRALSLNSILLEGNPIQGLSVLYVQNACLIE